MNNSDSIEHNLSELAGFPRNKETKQVTLILSPDLYSLILQEFLQTNSLTEKEIKSCPPWQLCKNISFLAGQLLYDYFYQVEYPLAPDTRWKAYDQLLGIQSVLEEALHNSVQLNSEQISNLITALKRVRYAMIDSSALLSSAENSGKKNSKK